ncbi:oleosin-B6-like [Cebus imitator]|uniref:oleosin-B6-like n=1 Tax=Cebus imitator TaxID=2715852 RepID=UPI00189882A7|nr:oleosin-B6-like [Cebus imitator]
MDSAPTAFSEGKCTMHESGPRSPLPAAPAHRMSPGIAHTSPGPPSPSGAGRAEPAPPDTAPKVPARPRDSAAPSSPAAAPARKRPALGGPRVAAVGPGPADLFSLSQGTPLQTWPIPSSPCTSFLLEKPGQRSAFLSQFQTPLRDSDLPILGQGIVFTPELLR